MRTAGLGIVFGFALLLITGVYLANTLAIMERVAIIDHVEGSPELLVHGKGTPARVQQGKLVRAGDIIRTGPNDTVDLRWARWVGGMRIKVGPNSRFLIKKATMNRSTKEEESRLRLDAGTIWVRLRDALRPNSKFEVETPTVVAAVRGTIFRVTVDKGGVSRVEVYAGTVDVRGEGGARATLTAGSESEVSATQKGARSEPLSESHRREWRSQDGIVGPLLQITEPQDGTAAAHSVVVKGRAEPGAAVAVNGEAVAVDAEKGTFSHTVSLQSGKNTITVRAQDTRGGETQLVRTVIGQ